MNRAVQKATTERAIQVVWWIGLIGALVITAAILKLVMLVVRALQDIHRLAYYTREAARGVAGNVAEVSRQAELEEPARRLREATGDLASATASVERKLDGLAAGAAASSRRGG